jgi:hypothetical protein
MRHESPQVAQSHARGASAQGCDSASIAERETEYLNDAQLLVSVKDGDIRQEYGPEAHGAF